MAMRPISSPPARVDEPVRKPSSETYERRIAEELPSVSSKLLAKHLAIERDGFRKSVEDEGPRLTLRRCEVPKCALQSVLQRFLREAFLRFRIITILF